MPSQCPELRVEVSRLGNKYLAVTKRSDGQEILSTTFQHDSSSPTDLRPLWLVDGGISTSQEERIPKRGWRLKPNLTQASADGRRLYRYLFGNGKALRNYLAEYQEQEHCYLTLSIGHEAESLWRLPWEYLFDGRQFPCLNGDLLISRRPADIRTLLPQAAVPPLHVLAVIANPEDQAAYDVALESSILQESLEDLIGSGAVDLEILTEPTSLSLLGSVREKQYEIIHFIGHGVYHLAQNQGFLCFEDGIGRTELLSGAQLPRFLEGWSPGLLLLSSCQGAQVGVFDAFTSVAEALLRHDIPSVLTIPASLEPPAAVAFLKSLYSSLADGTVLIESLHQGRLALMRIDDELPPDRQRFHWGLPALYQRAPELRLVHPEAAIDDQTSSGESTAPPQATDQVALKPVIGRKQELQALRKALKTGDNVFYIWGSEGIGKRHLMAHLLSRLSPRPSAILTIHCRESLEPVTALGKIARFWHDAAPDSNSEAAELLLDPRQDPFERARAAQQLLAKKRYVFLFDEIDAWFDAGSSAAGTIADSVVRDVLLGMLNVPGRSVFFFTGTRRWADLATVGTEHQREIHLPLLPLQPAVRLMNQWPELRQLSQEQKQMVFWHLGGHPKALQFLAGWLHYGEDLASLLASPPVTDRSTEAWIVFLIRAILDRLDPGERDVLRALVLLKRPFSAAVISDLTPVAAQHTGALIEKWLRLGLIDTSEPHAGHHDLLVVQTTVQRVISDDLTPAEANALHLQAAACYSAPLIDAARRQVLARNITSWSRARIEWLASDTNGILGVWLRQPGEADQASQVLERALAWQYHLAEAGAVESAAHLVQTITPELNRQGQRDLARKLQQRTADASEGSECAHDGDAWGELRAEAHQLSSALRVYERIYESLDPAEAGTQRAHLLVRAADLRQRMGDRQTAVIELRSALEAMRQAGDEKGEAECLYRLATVHRAMADHKQALVYSQAAKERYEALTLPYGLANVEREQGQILQEMGRLEGALERFAASLSICRRLDNRPCIAANLTDIGAIFERLGKTEMAIQVIEEALDHYEYLKGPDHGEILSLLEQLYARQHRLNEALARFRTSKRESEAES